MRPKPLSRVVSSLKLFCAAACNQVRNGISPDLISVLCSCVLQRLLRRHVIVNTVCAFHPIRASGETTLRRRRWLVWRCRLAAGGGAPSGTLRPRDATGTQSAAWVARQCSRRSPRRQRGIADH